MNRINKTFNKLKEENKTAFIPYITGGDSTLKKTKKYFEVLESSGADIIEIGIPFSDPLADGPIIQAAAERALANGTSARDIIKLTKKIRKNSDTPIVYLVYINTILIYGVEQFITDCKDAGVDGLIIPDLPYEEREEVTRYLVDDRLALIPLVAPTSLDRIQKIVETSSGFVYCVSTLGVTGGDNFYGGIESYLADVRSKTDLPIAIGFGIRTREDVERFAPHVDGVICGSAIVDCIDKNGGSKKALSKFVENLNG